MEFEIYTYSEPILLVFSFSFVQFQIAHFFYLEKGWNIDEFH